MFFNFNAILTGAPMQYSKTSGSIWAVNKPIPVVQHGWGDLPLEVTFLT